MALVVARTLGVGACVEVTEKLELNLIDPPREGDRAAIDPAGISELAASIKELGLLNPLVVAKRDDRYEVVAGHRRLLAVGSLGWLRVECTVIEADPDRVLSTRLTENVHREGLTPFEEGYALRKMRHRLGLSMAKLGALVGKTDAWVALRLGLLSWPENLARAVHDGSISLTAGRFLADITDGVERDRLLAYAVASGASCSITQAWRDQWRLSQTPVDTAVKPVGWIDGRPPPLIVRYPCAVCRAEVSAEAMRILRVCEGCQRAATSEVALESAAA